MKFKSRYWLTPMLCSLVVLNTSCSSVDTTSSSDSSDNVLTGTFVDSAVENINYRTDSQSGTTNEDGEYQYKEGEDVIFSIGDADLPTIKAGEKVTPLDFAENEDEGTEDTVVVNISRLLQTLDDDGNPDNGITIPDDAHDATDGDVVDFSDDNFEDDAGVQKLLVNGGGSGQLVSETEAVDHLETSLDTDNDGITNDQDTDDDNDGITDENDPQPLTANAQETNTTPVADAGDDQDVTTNDTVNLDGSGSSDNDQDSLTYTWSFLKQPTGSSAELSSINNVTTSFIPDIDGTYRIGLVVNDGIEDSSINQIIVTATSNSIPVADAGDDQSVNLNDVVTLDGSGSSDADLDNLDYQWQFTSVPNGSGSTLSNDTTQSPSFTADTTGTYVVRLVVNDGTDDSSIDSVSITVEEESNAATADWIINSGSARSSYIDSDANASLGALVNVESVATVTINGKDYAAITTSGVPSYTFTMTQNDIDDLYNSRYDPVGDFGADSSSISITAGSPVAFGEDIGYVIGTRPNGEAKGCELGYWPPGPECPTDQAKTGNFILEPKEATSVCETTLNAMGYMLNGTSIYNWGDGTSYNDEHVWQLSAAVAEVYDVDVCGGHAANGDYHHHFNSSCLEDTLNDDGTGHSPVYGYAADGYPVYGKWYANGVLAKPSWVARDYTDSSKGGCSNATSVGERECSLNDQYDLSAGVTYLNSGHGPNANDGTTYTTQSGNVVSAESGLFYEDYYHDSSLVGSSDEYLDSHNGHDHDGIGYHYHITVEESDNTTPKFPYIIGPTFYGELDENSVYSCSSNQQPPQF